MNDLEICKKIAEIEGVDGHELTGVFIPSDRFNSAINDMHDNVHSYSVHDYEYNPLTDDALCFKLMIKYGINISKYYKLRDEKPYYGAEIDLNEIEATTPNKAICIAIIEAHNE